MEYSNKEILDRMQYYGMGSRKACTEILGMVTLSILDVIDNLEKGDSLRIRHLGSLSVQLEPQVWRFVPMLRLKFRRSRPKRWLFVFDPNYLIKREMPTRWPDEVHPPHEEKPQDPSAKAASTADGDPADGA